MKHAFEKLQDVKAFFKYYTKNFFAIDSAIMNEYDSAFKLLSNSQPEVIGNTIAAMILNLKNPNSFKHSYHTEFTKKIHFFTPYDWGLPPDLTVLLNCMSLNFIMLIHSHMQFQ